MATKRSKTPVEEATVATETATSALSIPGVEQQVVDYVAEQIRNGVSDTKGIFDHAKEIDSSMAGWNLQKFNASVHRKVRRALAAGGEIPTSPSRTSTRRGAGSRRKQIDTSGFRDMLMAFARTRLDGGQEDDGALLRLYSKFDPRAAQFVEVMHGLAKDVDGANGKAGVFDVLTSIDARAEEVARLFE
jgi:hypothetical protein